MFRYSWQAARRRLLRRCDARNQTTSGSESTGDRISSATSGSLTESLSSPTGPPLQAASGHQHCPDPGNAGAACHRSPVLVWGRGARGTTGTVIPLAPRGLLVAPCTATATASTNATGSTTRGAGLGADTRTGTCNAVTVLDQSRAFPVGSSKVGRSRLTVSVRSVSLEPVLACTASATGWSSDTDTPPTGTAPQAASESEQLPLFSCLCLCATYCKHGSSCL